MKKKKTTIPGIIKWVIAIILVVMQVYPFFYVFTSSFKSLDDFRQRTKASKTVIDTMVDLGILADLPASNQLSLFDF